MKARDFCYWLQGFFEISGETELGAGQVERIQKHLALVFKHEIDPSFGDAEKQKALNKIHGKVPGPGRDDLLLRC